MNNKIKFGLVWNILDKLINQLLYFLILIYIGKIIGPYSFGLIGVASVFITLSESLINYGFSQALIQKNKINNIDSSTIFYTSLASSLVIYISFFILSERIALFYNMPELSKIICILLTIIIVNSISVVPKAILLIDFRYHLITVSNCIATIVSSAVAIYLLNSGYSYWSFVYFNVIRATLNVLFIFYFAKWLPSLIFSFLSLKEFARFSIFLSLSGILSSLVNNAYVLLIGKYFNSFNVGLFTQANNISSMLSGVLTSIIQGVAFPTLSKSKQNSASFERDFITLFKANVLLTLPVLVGFCLISNEFIYIFLGSDWNSLAPILNLFALAKIFSSLSIVNINAMNAVGRSDIFFISDLLKLPIIFLGIIISIQFSLYYVSLSFLITSVISYIITVFFSKKVINTTFFRQIKMMAPFVFSTLLMYIIVSSVQLENIYFSIISKITSGFLIYTLSLISFYKLDKIYNNGKNQF